MKEEKGVKRQRAWRERAQDIRKAGWSSRSTDSAEGRQTVTLLCRQLKSLLVNSLVKFLTSAPFNIRLR